MMTTVQLDEDEIYEREALRAEKKYKKLKKSEGTKLTEGEGGDLKS